MIVHRDIASQLLLLRADISRVLVTATSSSVRTASLSEARALVLGAPSSTAHQGRRPLAFLNLFSWPDHHPQQVMPADAPFASCRGRHFTVLGNNVTFISLSLANGSTAACVGGIACEDEGNGGCLLLRGLATTVVRTSFIGCSASVNGGAVYVAAGAVLEGVSVFESKALYGGAVWTSAAVAVGKGSELRSCRAFRGGGVFVQGPGGAFSARQSRAVGCAAQDAGGVICAVQQASIVLDGVVIQNNTVLAHGGAVYLEDGGTLQVGGSSVLEGNSVISATPFFFGSVVSTPISF